MVPVLEHKQNYNRRDLRLLVEGAVSRFGVQRQLAGWARMGLGV